VSRPGIGGEGIGQGASDVKRSTAIRHLAAVFAACLVHSLATARSISPRYRLTSYLTGVVMVSAFFELGLLALRWWGAFTWDGTAYVLSDSLFSNGFRYMNWSIDVPVLLTQLLIVAFQTIRDAKAKSSPGVAKMFSAVWYLFLVSWTIYPLAYLMPQIWNDPNGVVARNLISSFADISSKAVYGVLLAAIAQKLSAEQGYQEAIDSASWVERSSADADAR
jgi:bacteriorhodopsin